MAHRAAYNLIDFNCRLKTVTTLGGVGLYYPFTGSVVWRLKCATFIGPETDPTLGELKMFPRPL